MRYLIAGLVGISLLAGCAAYRQARTDYDTGLTTPLEEGETAPRDQAQTWTDRLKVFVPQAGVALVPFTIFFTFVRGRRIRKGKPAVDHPITGKVGNLEWLVQRGSDIFAGLFEVGPDGSSLKRGWKVVLATSIAGGIVAIPAINQYANNEFVLGALIAVISGLIAAIEKKFSIVLPTIDPKGGTV